LAPQYGIKPIVGIDFRNQIEQQYIGIAKNNTGYQALNKHLSEHLHEKKAFQNRAPNLEDCFIIYPFSKLEKSNIQLSESEYIGIGLQDLKKLPFSPIRKWKDKLVVLNTISFRNKRDFNTHRLLRAIDNNCLLSKLPVSEQALETDQVIDSEAIAELYKDFPYILGNTERLMQTCNIDFDFSKDRKPQNQQCYTDSPEEDQKLIRELSYNGLLARYGNNPGDTVLKRVEKELKLIAQMEFTSYFLINWDIVQYAKSKNYFHVGRGSGANSIIAYLLEITDVDPIDLDLYFERFINLYRSTPPDFDIDFSWKDREDITAYIFSKFKHTALLATYNTFQYRASVRELGKVFGLPKPEIDKLTNGRFRMEELDHISKLVLRYSTFIEGMPNHLGIHAGGILISEKPLHAFSATHLPPKGFPTVMFDMVIAEDIGLYKFDILGQRGLAKIKEALSIIQQNQPEKSNIDIYDIKRFKQDSKVNNLIKKAACLGCFYVESPAMRMLLKKLEVDNYLGLVAASSIIRPGVAQSGMMREYILRHRQQTKTKDIPPVMLDIMPDTYGVMVYQEDVIKVAHYFAGLDLSEADVLRRGMSGKYRSREEFQRVRSKFFENCRKKGHSHKLSTEIWRQIESFAGYSFAKGHSASYAVESYQSLFLKAYYPLEYMVAVLNNGGGFYRPEVYVHEARMLGAKIEAPCIQESLYMSSIQKKTIYLGFHFLNGLEKETAGRIIQNRTTEGPFESFEDFLIRVPIPIEQISILIRIGAFRFCGVHKRNLLWKAHFFISKQLQEPSQKKMFQMHHKQIQIPTLDQQPGEAAFDEIELLGFPLSNPFLLIKEKNRTKIDAATLPQYLHKTIQIDAYLICTKTAITSTGKKMLFGTFIDSKGIFLDTVHFPNIAEQYPMRGRGIYRLEAKVIVEFDFYSLEVIGMYKLDMISDPRYTD
jgi:DNA polymerase-3 subunit alpha